MKNLIIVACLVGLISVNAQKGTYLLDGSFGFNISKINENNGWINSSNSFNFSPKLGYQYSENWTAGIQLGYYNSFSERLNTNTNLTDKSEGYNYGGFLRYNKKISESFNFFTDLSFGISNGKLTSEYIDNSGFKNKNSTDENGVNLYISPAISLIIKNNFRLNINIGGLAYNYARRDLESNQNNNSQSYNIQTHSSNFSITFGQTFAFGISKNF